MHANAFQPHKVGYEDSLRPWFTKNNHFDPYLIDEKSIYISVIELTMHFSGSVHGTHRFSLGFSLMEKSKMMQLASSDELQDVRCLRISSCVPIRKKSPMRLLMWLLLQKQVAPSDMSSNLFLLSIDPNVIRR